MVPSFDGAEWIGRCRHTVQRWPCLCSCLPACLPPFDARCFTNASRPPFASMLASPGMGLCGHGAQGTITMFHGSFHASARSIDGGCAAFGTSDRARWSPSRTARQRSPSMDGAVDPSGRAANRLPGAGPPFHMINAAISISCIPSGDQQSVRGDRRMGNPPRAVDFAAARSSKPRPPARTQEPRP
jgi:hypothetical protein